MEIHHLSFSITSTEIRNWILSRPPEPSLEIIDFRSEEGGFRVQLKYKKLSFPLKVKLLEANHSFLRLEISSLPRMLKVIPLKIQQPGVELKGREVWIDLLTASGGKIERIDIEDLAFHPDRITVKVRDLLLSESMLFRQSS